MPKTSIVDRNFYRVTDADYRAIGVTPNGCKHTFFVGSHLSERCQDCQMTHPEVIVFKRLSAKHPELTLAYHPYVLQGDCSVEEIAAFQGVGTMSRRRINKGVKSRHSYRTNELNQDEKAKLAKKLRRMKESDFDPEQNVKDKVYKRFAEKGENKYRKPVERKMKVTEPSCKQRQADVFMVTNSLGRQVGLTGFNTKELQSFLIKQGLSDDVTPFQVWALQSKVEGTTEPFQTKDHRYFIAMI